MRKYGSAASVPLAISTFLMFLKVPNLTNKQYLIFAYVTYIFYGMMYIIGFTPFSSNPYLFLVLVFFSGAGQTFLVMEIWALVMDVIDYHELLSGRREEGTSYSLYSFGRKLGQTAAGAGVPALLGAIGYDGELAVQTSEVTEKLYTASTLIPAGILPAMFLLLTFAYKLSKKELQKLHEKLEEVQGC